MATKKSIINPIQITPGVQPRTDRTPYSTPHYTFSDKVRFWRGIPQKIGGWLQVLFEFGLTIMGVARTLYSAVISNVATTVIGTNSYLYALYGQILTNITPLQTSTTAIPNSLSTDFSTLANNPITTTIGTGNLVVADTNASAYQVGDLYTLSGSTSVNGILAASINAQQFIRALGTNTVSITVAGSATSSGAGGGNSVARATGLMTAAATANGIVNGERIKISFAAEEMATSAVQASPGTVFVPDTLLTAEGGIGTSAVFDVVTTQVVSATVNAGGTGGTPGTQTVTGTTGTGTKFQASVTVSGGGSITAILSITIGGDYTVNPTDITTEPVTGASLSAATLAIVMGVNTVSVNTPGSYTSVPSNPVATTSNGTGSGATLNVSYSGSTNVGGISNSDINQEFIARDTQTNSFQFMTAGTATSAVTGGGGTTTVYSVQLAAGQVDASFGSGYGLGNYGVGLYGTAKSSQLGITYPRTWFMDRFGDDIIMTPGNQGSIYSWNGDTTRAPAVLANAPTAVNYLFVSNNIIITFGYQNVANQIFTCDIANPTIWTASNNNQVFQDVIYGANQLISSVPVLGIDLIFTPNQTYTFSYIGLPLIWNIQLIDNSIGIIAPMARCSVNNVAYWMGQNNFYYWAGGNVTIIPANSQDQCTMLNYVFSNINRGQASKSFAEYNQIFNEVWFHYPSASNDECDSVARVTLDDMVWSPDTLQRGCAEYPQNLFNVPRMIDVNGNLFNHETGYNDNTNPLPFALISNVRTAGKDTALLSGFVPDSLQTGTINCQLTAALFPQTFSTPTFQTSYAIDDNNPREEAQIGGRFWQYNWNGDELNQNWIMGSWFELLQDSASN